MAKILIVEDDEFYRKIYKHKFELLKDQVEIATNGEEGLKKVVEFMPDVILMDIMMPKMNGFDALDKLKADDHLKEIPVLMLTNLSSGQDTSEVFKKGAVGCLIKSDVTPDEVAEKVAQILKR